MTANMHAFANGAELAGKLADKVAETLSSAIAARGSASIAVSGGSTPKAFFQALSSRAIDWGKVTITLVDERFVPADSPDRNAGQARSAFLDAVGASRVHEMAASDSGVSLEEGAAAYAAEIRSSPTDRFDLVMLGMGPDGHVASIFPGHPAAEVDAVVVPVTDSPKPPPERISLSTEALCHSERVWFVVSGEEKADAAERARAGDQSLPAARVHGHTETLWFQA